jgi:hypothetical protein
MAYSVDQSIFLMVVVNGEVQVLCCEQFMLCKGVVGSLLVCNDNASILVRWRTITPSCTTGRVSRLRTGTQTGDRFTSTLIANEICI